MTVHGTWKRQPEWGEARIVRSLDSGVTRLEYFVLPGTEPRSVEVSAGEIGPPIYERGQRVFVSDGSGGLQSGRLAEEGLHEAAHVALEFPGPVSAGPVLLVEMTGGGRRSLPPELLEVCSGVDVSDPTSMLASMANEGSWWFHARTKLRRALAKERAVFRGLSGLASSSIDIHPHQIRVARKILGDPVCRYVLADEVGLGKTIEAGIVIRQHVLESSGSFRVLVVTPEHLKQQWRSELERKFGLAGELRLGSVEVSSFADVQALIRETWEGRGPEMLVVDEAHHLASFAFSESVQEKAVYELLTDASSRASRVLLLSATPVLRDTAGFLAMLHLLDRDAYDIADLEGFARKVEARDEIASLAYLLSRPVMPMFRPGVLGQLDETTGTDATAMEFAADLTRAWATQDDEAAERSRTRLHAYLRAAHQVYGRLIRTRRDESSVAPDLPSRKCRVVPVDSPFQEKVTAFLDDWRLARLDASGSVPTSPQDRRLFATWVALGFEAPRELLSALRARHEHLTTGGFEAFPGETTVLSGHVLALREAIKVAAQPVVDFLQVQSHGDRWVVFLSDDSLCTLLSTALGPRAEVIGAAAVGHDILIVPTAGEEGINLQGRRASLLHGDLPMSTVRIEQRIGRMDRLKSANLNVESVVLYVPGTYQGAWVRATYDAGMVLEASVSSLQYLIAEAENCLREELLEHGVEAFQRYADRLQAPDGHFSLEHEAVRLQRQDILDAAQMRPVESWYEEIEEYEFDEFRETVLALKRWLVDGVRFKPLDPGGRRLMSRYDPRDPHRLRLRDRHLTRSEVRRWFGAAMARDTTGLPHNVRDAITGVLAGDRSKAQSGEAALTRVGNALVSGVQQMLHTDGRGRTFAVRLGPARGGLEPYFRFDVRLEGRPTEDDPVIVRRTEELLPPRYITIWLNREGQPIPSDLEDFLEGELDGDKARSLVGPEAWGEVLADFEADWRTLVFGLRDVAVTMAEADKEWARSRADSSEQIEVARSELAAALRARESVGQSDAKSDSWGREFYFLDQLEETVRAASAEVEALGVVFHAGSAADGD